MYTESQSILHCQENVKADIRFTCETKKKIFRFTIPNLSDQRMPRGLHCEIDPYCQKHCTTVKLFNILMAETNGINTIAKTHFMGQSLDIMDRSVVEL